jgi:hypothetical protein
MATLAEIGNIVGCGTGASLGTGTKGCNEVLEATQSLWVTPKGFKYDKSVDFDSAYIQQLKAEGKLIILDGIIDFQSNPEENQTETTAYGTTHITRKGLYAFTVMFQKGMYYNAALNSLNSDEEYDMAFVDVKGNILGTTASDSSLKGITVGMLQANPQQFGTASTTLKQGITFQFIYPDEIDSEDYYFVSYKQLDFKPYKETGVNQVNLEMATPGDASTSLVVKGKLANGGSVFTGAVLANFLVTVDGSTVTPSNLAESPSGTYTFTVSAVSTNEVVTVALYDTANSRQGIVLDTEVYKSKTVSATVS